MANELAHKINNPIQSMTNSAYLVASGQDLENTQALGLDLEADIQRLSGLVKDLLTIPFEPEHPTKQ